MPRAGTRAGTGGDSGAVAVLVALLVAFVLLPVAALGLTGYVRAGVDAELQRAADSGALAGATSLLFVDLSSTGTASANGAVLLPDGPACRAALRALGSATAPHVQRDHAPLAAAFASPTPACTAAFSTDEAYPDCVRHLVSQAEFAVAELERRLGTVLAAVPLLGDEVRARRAVSQAVFDLVPAAAVDGLSVTLDFSVQGPLDGALGRSGPTPRRVTGTARRLFKPLLPSSPRLVDGLAGRRPLDDARLPALLTAAYAESGAPQLGPTQVYAVALLQLHLNSVRHAVALASGGTAVLDSVPDPLNAFFGSTTSLLTAQLGPLVPTPLRPLVDATLLAPLPAVPPLNPLTPTCQAAALELVDALARALEVNQDPARQDLALCLAEQVLDAPPDATPQPADCVEQLFRASLRSDRP